MRFKCTSSRARRIEIVVNPGDILELSCSRAIQALKRSPYFGLIEEPKAPVKKAAKKKAEVKDGSNSIGDGE